MLVLSLTRYIYNNVGHFLLVTSDIWLYQDTQIFPHCIIIHYILIVV